MAVGGGVLRKPLREPPECRAILPGVLGVPPGDPALHPHALVAFVSTHAIGSSCMVLSRRATAATSGGSRTRLGEFARSGARHRCILLAVSSGGFWIGF